jgi:hypothetical protein
VAQFPASELRNNATRNVVQQWVHNDVEAASKWIATLPADPSRDQAIETLVNVASHERPEIAAQWLDSLPNENARRSRAEMIAQRWLQTDEAAARAWINQSSLPQESKNRLLNRKF